jgi:hypothetical protein
MKYPLVMIHLLEDQNYIQIDLVLYSSIMSMSYSRITIANQVTMGNQSQSLVLLGQIC